jgi:hypothetical protein
MSTEGHSWFVSRDSLPGLLKNECAKAWEQARRSRADGAEPGRGPDVRQNTSCAQPHE